MNSKTFNSNWWNIVESHTHFDSCQALRVEKTTEDLSVEANSVKVEVDLAEAATSRPTATRRRACHVERRMRTREIAADALKKKALPSTVCLFARLATLLLLICCTNCKTCTGIRIKYIIKEKAPVLNENTEEFLSEPYTEVRWLFRTTRFEVEWPDVEDIRRAVD